MSLGRSAGGRLRGIGMGSAFFGKPCSVVGACIALLVGLGLLELPGCASAVKPAPLRVSAFGGHLMRPAEPSHWPTVPMGSIRTWDARGLQWPDVEPQPGGLRWTQLDDFVDRAQASGYAVVYTFGRVPRWAAAGSVEGCAYTPEACGPPDPEALHRFVTAIATRYRGRIAYWELWNEPQLPEFFAGDLDALVRTVKVISAALRAADPSAVVLSPPGTGDDGPNWFARFLGRAPSRLFDVATFHGYHRGPAAAVGALVTRYRQVLDVAGLDRLALWDTEGSWGRNASLQETSSSYLAEFLIVQFAAGVERVFWYAWDNTLWGSLWSDDTGAQPAAAAYRKVVTWTLGAQLSPCVKKGTAWRCALQRGDTSSEVLWADAPTTFPIQTALACERLDGSSVRFEAVAQVDNSPMLCLKDR